MGKRRSIQQQLNYVISDNCRIGHSKRAENGTNTGYVYSVQYAENLRDTARNLANYLRSEWPDVKWVKDIKSEHIQAWLDKRSPNWSNATLTNHVSRLKIIEKQIIKTYKIDIDWKFKVLVKENFIKIRDVAMTREDYNNLQKKLDQGNSAAKIATSITARTGLRIKEIARLKVDNINLNDMVIEVRDGAKNGKYRDVPIRPSDREFFNELKNSLIGQVYVCDGAKEDSINTGIRRAMKSLGLAEKYKSTSNHAIRKMYARETYEQLIEQGYSDKKAWCQVQKDLGHSDKYRQSLFDTYIKN